MAELADRIGLDSEATYTDVNEQVQALAALYKANVGEFWRVVRGMVAMLNTTYCNLSLEDGESAALVLCEPGSSRLEVTVHGEDGDYPGSLVASLHPEQLWLLGIAAGTLPADSTDATVAVEFGVDVKAGA